VAQTERKGDFKYLIRVDNNGNVPLSNYILYDVLPYIGDTGVGEPLASSERGTQWNPVLNGAVTIDHLPDGITKDDVKKVKAFRVKVDFNDQEWEPLKEMRFKSIPCKS